MLLAFLQLAPLGVFLFVVFGCVQILTALDRRRQRAIHAEIAHRDTVRRLRDYENARAGA